MRGACENILRFFHQAVIAKNTKYIICILKKLRLHKINYIKSQKKYISAYFTILDMILNERKKNNEWFLPKRVIFT
jgi:hypothetical protein